jgi:lipopolysaccharide/colanic/teichoic acid biosynthesis glycosyltransferase
VPYTGTALLVGSITLVVVEAVTGLGGFTALVLLIALVAISAAIDRGTGIVEGRRVRKGPVRVAVIGGTAIAGRLRTDLDRMSRRLILVGRIAGPGEPDGSAGALTELDRLREAVVEHDIQLLILGPTVPRLQVFEELVSRCLELPVRLVELSAFYEAVFGFVPLSEMNAVWFQYLLDPAARLPRPFAKRAIDLVGVALLAMPALPLCGLLALLVRRDGGPGIFRQRRIGEGGRPFTLYKLRTMRPSNDTTAQWAAIDDRRVTRLGRYLRSTHLDELPQLLNVLRGEMSLVGPRPEQPAVVERLEREVRFYQRRHLIRPGITGWAQIRCGYARSDSGSVRKHSHDLYYLKHRSIRFDLRILAVTTRLVVLGAIRGRESIARPSQPPPETIAVPDAVEQVEPDGGLAMSGGNHLPAGT